MIFGLVQTLPDLAPTSSWVDGKQLPISIVRSSPNQVDCLAGSKPFSLTFERAGEVLRISLQPAKDMSVSFRKLGKSFSVRTVPDDFRIMQFGVGHPYSRLNNGLLTGAELLSVKAAEVAVYGCEMSGAVRVRFTKTSSTAVFTKKAVPEARIGSTQWKNPASVLTTIIIDYPQRASLLPKLSDDAKTWYATVAGLAGIRLESEKIGPLQTVSDEPQVQRLDYSEKPEIPEIIVTHVEEQGRQSAWVGLFNQTDRPRSLFISPEKIGLASEMSYAATDFWQWRFLGNFAGTLAVTVPAQGCRLIVLKPASNVPDVLCSTSQILGKIGVATFDQKANILKGSLSVKSDFLISCVGQAGDYLLPSATFPARYLGNIAHISAPNPGSWSVRFSSIKPTKATTRPALIAVAGYPWRVTFLKDATKEKQFIGHYIFRNDQLVAYFADNELFDDDVDPGTQYIYSVVGVTPSGDVSMPEKLDARTEWPLSFALTALFPEQVSPTFWYPRNGFLPDGTRLLENGEFIIGYGLPANSKVIYRLSRAFESLQVNVTGDIQFRSNGNTILLDGDTIDLSQTDKLTIESKTGGAIVNPRLTAKPRP